MINKFFFFLMILLVTNCGYQPIFSKKDKSILSFNNISFEGNKSIGRQMVPLLGLNNNKSEESLFSLKLISTESVDTVAKDSTGSASVYKTTINVILSLNKAGEKIKEKNFTEYFTYSNMDNKFDLSQYQRDIKKNLINKISNEILVFLSTE